MRQLWDGGFYNRYEHNHKRPFVSGGEPLLAMSLP